MFGSCAVSVVPFPSGKSHFPLIVPPTMFAKGATTTSFGLLSLKGLPKKPQTTPALVAGVTVGDAWMCAAIRLSFVSAVCDPVKSMLKMDAAKAIEVIALFNTNKAVPKDAGLGSPPLVVGIVGGFS